MAIKHVKVVCATCFPDDACKEVGTNEWNDCHVIDCDVDFVNNCAVNVKGIHFQEIGQSFGCGVPVSITTSCAVLCPCFGTDLNISICVESAIHFKVGLTQELIFTGGLGGGQLDFVGGPIVGLGQMNFACGGGITSGCCTLRITAGNCGILSFREPSTFSDRVLLANTVGGGELAFTEGTPVCFPDESGKIVFEGGITPTIIYSTITGIMHSYDNCCCEDGTLRFHTIECGTLTNYLELSGLCKTIVAAKPFVYPSFTDCSRPCPCTVAAGGTIFNTTDGGLNVSDGTNWRGPSACGGWANT